MRSSIKLMIMTIWYADFCILILYILTSYQDQEAVVVEDDIPPSILHPLPYPPAGQPFIETNVQYSNFDLTSTLYTAITEGREQSGLTSILYTATTNTVPYYHRKLMEGSKAT